MAKKKKKKKEEFDVALMGGYLPGARPVLSLSIVGIVPQDVLKVSRTPPSTVTFSKMNFGERLNYQIQSIALGWSYYAFKGGPLQIAAQTPQAWGAYKFGVYPSFKIALIAELGIATAALATLHTIMDPHRVWRKPFRGTVEPPVDWEAMDKEANVWGTTV